MEYEPRRYSASLTGAMAGWRALSKLAVWLAVSVGTIHASEGVPPAHDAMSTDGAKEKPFVVEPHRKLGPNDPVSLKLSCADLFANPISSVEGVFQLLKMGSEENWTELTELEGCVELFSANCEVLNFDHVRELLQNDGWSWAGKGSTARSSSNRFNKLAELGCTRRIKPWDAVKMEDLPALENVRLEQTNNWSNFQPDVLAAKMKMEGVISDMPFLGRSNERYLMRLLASDLFKSANEPNWVALGPGVRALVADKGAKLGGPYAELLATVGKGLLSSHSVWMAGLVTYMEAFLEALLTTSRRYSSNELVEIIGKMVEIRQEMYKVTDSEVLRALLVHPSPRLAGALERFGDDLTSKLVQTLDDFRLGAEEGRKHEQPTLRSFLALMELDGCASPAFREAWVTEYLLLYPASLEELQEHQLLLKGIFSRDLHSLTQSLAPLEDGDYSDIAFPMRPFRICSIMLTARAENARDCAEALKKAIGQNRERLFSYIVGVTSAHEDTYPAAFAIARDSQDMRTALVLPDDGVKYPAVSLSKYSEATGFDVREFITWIMEDPAKNMRVFAHPSFMIKVLGSGAIDFGGLTRALITQLLNEINSRLTAPLSSEQSFVRKFIWTIDSRMGRVVGATIGKAIEMGIRLPFIPDRGFFGLLKTQTKEDIARYYDERYKEEYVELQQRPEGRANFAFTPLSKIVFTTLKKTSNVIPPEADDDYVYEGVTGKLRRSILGFEASSAASDESISGDSGDNGDSGKVASASSGESNNAVPSTADAEGAKMVEEPSDAVVDISTYHVQLRSKLEAEFAEFAEQFRIGMSVALRTGGIPFLPQQLCVTALLNPEAPTADKIIAALNVDDGNAEREMDSLIPGHKMTATNVLHSIIKALTPAQGAKFVEVSTGTPLLELSQEAIECNFILPEVNPKPKVTILYYMTKEQWGAYKEGKKIALTPEQKMSKPLEETAAGASRQGASKRTARGRGFSAAPQEPMGSPPGVRRVARPLSSSDEEEEGDGANAEQGRPAPVARPLASSDEEEEEFEGGEGVEEERSTLVARPLASSSGEEEEDHTESVMRPLLSSEEDKECGQMSHNPLAPSAPRPSDDEMSITAEANSSSTESALLAERLQTMELKSEDPMDEEVSRPSTAGAATSGSSPANVRDDAFNAPESSGAGDIKMAEKRVVATAAEASVKNAESEPYIVVAPGADYLALVRRVAAIQAGMLELKGYDADTFEESIIHDGESSPAYSATCSQSVFIPVGGTAAQMIHSFVILLNTLTTTFYDGAPQ